MKYCLIAIKGNQSWRVTKNWFILIILKGKKHSFHVVKLVFQHQDQIASARRPCSLSYGTTVVLCIMNCWSIDRKPTGMCSKTWWVLVVLLHDHVPPYTVQLLNRSDGTSSTYAVFSRLGAIYHFSASVVHMEKDSINGLPQMTSSFCGIVFTNYLKDGQW